MVDAGIQYRWSSWFMESDWLMIRCVYQIKIWLMSYDHKNPQQTSKEGESVRIFRYDILHVLSLAPERWSEKICNMSNGSKPYYRPRHTRGVPLEPAKNSRLYSTKNMAESGNGVRKEWCHGRCGWWRLVISREWWHGIWCDCDWWKVMLSGMWLVESDFRWDVIGGEW